MASTCSNSQTAAGQPQQTITLTVGTAGHIDHGKTALVKLLTGCDCDTLPEEKARGMTIDLGFATCTLPNNRRVGIVDVPGHERFIHNMVAGASGIDAVLLVVAADDGIMPQTIEHFHIVRLLGIKSGMIAITKIDIVPPERVEEVAQAVKNLMAGSFLEGCPIVPISPKTGAGFEAFYDAFVATVDKTAEHRSDGPFLMHIERSFVLKGRGTIISGIPRSGSVKVGEILELLPVGKNGKVRSLQVYGQTAEQGRAGECVALNMADMEVSETVRGAVLASPGYFKPAKFLNAKFHLIAGLDKPLKPRTAIRFHVGTADVTGHLVLPELESFRPGTETYVQLQLNDPVVATPGDFFVVRMLSPACTLGGGYILEPEKKRLRRSKSDDWKETCSEREDAFKDPVSALTYVLKNAGPKPTHISELSKLALVNLESTKNHLKNLCQKNVVLEFSGDRYIHTDFIADVKNEVMDILNRLHGEHPMSIGFEKKDLFKGLKTDHDMVEKALDSLLKDGKVKLTERGYQIPEHAPRLSPDQTTLAEKIINIYKKTKFASPRIDELPLTTGTPMQVIQPVIDFLVQTGDLVVISDKVVLCRDCVEESRQKLVEYIVKNGSIESGVFKDVLGTTRKYSIPLLEYWDSKGMTRRVGNVRYLKETQKR
ncbi:MAG: selenocysteine-specific translation elongation factor [Kiritimatiellae bacterium]|nr:selenocysteine-specific translation elongation factor [Kiritimatiellia bacterium]MDD5520129.1 selenocysteine-specific translation elongation factor [Kiritimatiellia bacterium]